MTSTAPAPAPTKRDGELRVSIVGGGASGVLTAANLLADPETRLRVTIHESAPVLGAGVAYGTTDPRHLLNVRARHMSAFPDTPSDLIDWYHATGRTIDPLAFLPRREYAEYLRDRLSDVADGRLQVHSGRVDDVVPTDAGYQVLSEGAEPTEADAVVLAYGNSAPAPLAVDGDALPGAAWHVADPWDLAWIDRLPQDGVVVLVGSGLTAVDTAITVLEDSPARRVVMVSRHGLLPAAHVEQQSTAWVSPVPDGPLTADQLATFFDGQVAAARRQGVDWRAVVDGLRAPTQSIWQRLDADERRRFLSRYARHWEVRRHRMAPEVAARLQQYRRDGRLRLVAGGLTGLTERDGRCQVRLGDEAEHLPVDAVVNCTGPQTDVGRSQNPLLQSLRERGLVAPDALRLGVSCRSTGEILDPSGAVVPQMYAVGPPRKGTLYESTAIPEIRAQAAAVARALTTAGSTQIR
ncbi:FAD/NAD(P)-binding protein [Nocardioides sp. URHA0020]|uniref:FAD/NAD(P)-binding protein n=1 Tax=Nocardioides sp. URHA0020 TaxID=1380392 RepID=UPI000685454E|nr:FAD/NAD(P)-binding protein [Nocardioides sp. URHA0020]